MKKNRVVEFSRMVVESIMPGPIHDSLIFVGRKFSSIKSGNSLFELIVFVLCYYDVAVCSYMLDHIFLKLPMNAVLIIGLFVSAFIKIILLLLFDEKGIAQ
jgi:hypothetical protein